MVKSSGKSRSHSRVYKKSKHSNHHKSSTKTQRVSKRNSRKSKAGKRKRSNKSHKKTKSHKENKNNNKHNSNGGNRKRTVRKTLRKKMKKMKGGRVALPSEYFGGNSGRYFDKPSTSYKTRHGASVGRSHGSGKVPEFRGTGPNLAPGMGGGKRIRKNKKIHRRTKKSKSRFSRK